MNHANRSVSARGLSLAAALSLALTVSSALAQKLDLDANNMSDIWEQIYSTTPLSPGADLDGDGVSNLLEALAGTNPFDSASSPKIPSTSYSSTNFSVTLPSELGKQYTLQSIDPITGPWTNWVSEVSTIARTGSVISLSAPITSASKLFRVAIADVDTDGDGLNDWEEYKIGLDPLDQASNGQLDPSFQPYNDYGYAAATIGSQNVVTITATDAAAMQPDAVQAGHNGVLTVSRGGFPLRDISVNLALAGSGSAYAVQGVDFASLPTSVMLPAGVSSQDIPVVPLANPARLNPKVTGLNLVAGVGYTIGNPNSARVTIYPTMTPIGTGLSGTYYTNANATYANAANFNAANLRLTRSDTNINFTWSGTQPFVNGGYFSVRWTGQIQPQYSEKYFFVANTDDGVKLWVNDVLIVDRWVLQGATDSVGSIDLVANVRYNIKMEYFNGGGGGSTKLYWYSISQPKQLIPASRMYPTNGPAAASAITSSQVAYGFLGQPFSFNVTGANAPTLYSASPLPPGLNFNTISGLLSGTPTLAGDFQIVVTSSNALGVGSALLTVKVIDTGSSLMREVWTGVPGTNISDIPLSTPANVTNVLGALEGITDFGDNYAERIRGYITAPVSANYYFWIAGNDSAELWISNNGEPVNKVRRSTVNPANPTAPREWTLANNQRSGWLALEAGQRYYVEVLHKAGLGTNDNWSVGWRQDPVGTNTIPTGLVPNHLLARFYPLPPTFVPGTLYAANMLPQSGAISAGVGTSTLRVNAAGTQAILKFSYGNLTTPVTARHIHADPYLAHPAGEILFDIDDAVPQPDGSLAWDIAPVGTYTDVADILEVIRQGKTYINIHTMNYPNGEINGHFTLAEGTQVFTPPPQPAAWTDDHSISNAAARFLIQASFGPSPEEIQNVRTLGYEGWIDNQFTLPPSYLLPIILAKVNSDPTTPYPGTTLFNTWWRQSVIAPDQLRQRVAFALSEIMVVSEYGVLDENGRALADYYDTLLDHAFGNFRELIEAVTLEPAMGLYLDMRANSKGDIVTGTHPNENYAREILQLFSVGLYRMWPDGQLILDSNDNVVPTYGQDEIMGFSAVFTGWNYYQPNQGNGRLPTNFSPPANYVNPMVLVPSRHELGTKRLLDNVVLPAAIGTQLQTASVDYDTYGLQDLEKGHDSIFYNENVGPFVCRQLIQRLVTSHPSRDYVYRVVQKFNDNGAGVRGDMQVVIKAILLDYEARSAVAAANPTFGKQREPLLRVTAAARAFPAPPDLGGTYSEAGSPTVTLTTTNAHRLNNGDTVFLSLTDTSGQTSLPSQNFSVNVTSPTAFTITAPGIATGIYTQRVDFVITNMLTGETNITTNAIVVTSTGHGLSVGHQTYLSFSTGGAVSSPYQVVATHNANSFIVLATEAVARGGNMYLPRFTGGGYVVSARTNLIVSTSLPHGLNIGDSVCINFTQAGSPADDTFQVSVVSDPTHFTCFTATNNNRTDNGITVFPLIPPPLNRSGDVVVEWNTFNMGSTDTGSSQSLSQTPLAAPTVFNYFFPDYKFPGILGSAGLTTPEFQLTSDTEAVYQMNFLQAGILGNGNNTNGLSSFNNGNGSMVLDIGPYMTPGFTANANLLTLVDRLNTLLCSGQLSSGARTQISNYASTFAYTTPTMAQMRDRVRAVVHQIINSPDYTVQR